ncbi:MAG: exopolysaccharide biosynthesis protein [Martelella sp.]|uniref:exopolysaccharide biosynthesis protein n=1 Tax=Martelella sp. TaxID=1969699 RepID=UPI003241CB03
MARHDDDPTVGEILDSLSDADEGKDGVTVGELMEAVGQRGFGVLLFVPALIELSPIGGIPGVPTALAAFIALVSSQLAIGRSHIWFPAFLERRTIPTDRLEGAIDWLRPVARFLDRWFHGRIRIVTKGPVVRLAAAACILLCLTVPPLELIPFASSAPTGAIAAFGLALIVQDGLLFIIAWMGWAAALSGVYFWLFAGS